MEIVNLSELMAGLGIAVIGMLGYFLRDAHSQLKEAFKSLEVLRNEVHIQSIAIATDFVRKTELKEIEAQLDKFSEALFGKIDTLSSRVDGRFESLTSRIDSKLESITEKFEKQISSLDDHVFKQLAKKQDRVE